MSPCYRLICIKIRMIGYISQITSIRKANWDFVVKTITSLLIYLDYYPNRLFVAKNTLYLAKTVANLSITCNKSKITPKNNVINKLVKYFGYCPNYLFVIKDILYSGGLCNPIFNYQVFLVSNHTHNW